MKKNKINEKNNTSNKLKPKDELIHLINNLNSSIKKYYNSTNQLILYYKQKNFNLNNKIEIAILNIQDYLQIFINEAKYIFNKMRIVRKQSLMEEEQNKKNQGQLYNYWNNNFFYYSNPAPSNVNTNSNYFTKIVNHGKNQKIIYKSPSNKVNNISNNKIIDKNNTQHSYQKFNNDSNLLFSRDNIISQRFNEQVNIPRLNIDQKSNKDELMNNIMNLLKQLNRFHSKINNETKEAQRYKNIFDMIILNLKKLNKIISKEKFTNSNAKCLTERKQMSKRSENNLIKILNTNKNYRSILTNIKNLKRESHSFQKFNKTYANFNSRNPINQKKYIFSIEHLKSRNESKLLIERKKRAKSDNSLDKRDKNKRQENIQINNLKGVFIKEGIDDYYNKKEQELKLKLLDKEQQTDNLTLKNEISKEINIYFEIDQNYKLKIIEREKLIKDLEDKIQILNDEIKSLNEQKLNLQKENDTYKIDLEKKNTYINSLNQEISILKQYIDKQENKKKEKEKEQNFSNEIKDNKNNSNNSNNKNEEIIADLDKISIKYELLKIEYERQKTDLEEKEKLLSDYNLTNLNDSKISSEEKINQIIKKYENKIEEMNQKHIKDILDLKINLPNCFTPSTHEILVDKKFKEYELHWYLLTITTAKKKDYENTFWVTEDEIKDSLEEFKQFKTEEDIEKENINIYAIAQEKLIKRIETNEDTISNLKKQIMKLKGEK